MGGHPRIFHPANLNYPQVPNESLVKVTRRSSDKPQSELELSLNHIRDEDNCYSSMAESRNLTTLTNIDYSNLPFAPENNIPQTLPPPLTEVIIPDNSHQNLNQVWTGPWTPPPQDCSVSSSSSSVQEPEAVRVIQQPQTSLPLPNIIQPAAPAEIMVVDERRADIRRRNNIAEKDYRRRKKVRRELVFK